LGLNGKINGSGEARVRASGHYFLSTNRRVIKTSCFLDVAAFLVVIAAQLQT
jgi:hypothetical protein